MKNVYIVIHFMLLTLIAYWGVDTFYMITTFQLQRTPVTEPVQQSNQRIGKTDNPRFFEYEAIIEKNLFGTDSSKPAAFNEQIDLEKLDRTRLKLKLYGTVIGDNNDPYAVIENIDLKDQSLYKEGDQVSGATIKLILRDKVVLSVSGNDEILEMVNFDGTRKTAQTVTRKAISRKVPEQYTTSLATAMRNQEVVVRRTEIDEAVGNISELMTQAAIRPHYEKGGGSDPAGLSVSNIKNDSIFKKMGLRNGDVVLGVNGKQIRSLDDALSLYESLRTSERVELQIQRIGNIREFQYVIE
jgi:general secretion pathway protein C